MTPKTKQQRKNVPEEKKKSSFPLPSLLLSPETIPGRHIFTHKTACTIDEKRKRGQVELR
jgi:hypothetical protein